MNNKLNIMLIGCGRWGSFIATYLDSNSLSFQTLLENRQNDYIKIPDTIKLTTDIKEAHANDVIIISVNSQNLRSVCYQLKDINLQNYSIGDKGGDVVKLPNITLPSGLESLGACCFENCTALQAIKLPGALTALPSTVMHFSTRGIPVLK